MSEKIKKILRQHLSKEGAVMIGEYRRKREMKIRCKCGRICTSWPSDVALGKWCNKCHNFEPSYFSSF